MTSRATHKIAAAGATLSKLNNETCMTMFRVSSHHVGDA